MRGKTTLMGYDNHFRNLVIAFLRSRRVVWSLGALAVLGMFGTSTQSAEPEDSLQNLVKSGNISASEVEKIRDRLSKGDVSGALSLSRKYVTDNSEQKFSSGISEFWKDLESALPASKGPFDVIMDDVELEASETFSRSFSSALAEGGNLTGSNVRVWGGARVLEPDVYEDAVGIVASGGKRCSGTLVAEDIVVSAAHCFCGKVDETIVIGKEIASSNQRFKIDKTRSGSYIPCSLLDTKPKIIKNITRGDVAIYRLKRKVKGIPIRKIASDKIIEAAASVRAVGFGRTKDYSLGIKYYVDVIIASHNCDGESEKGHSHKDLFGCRPRRELVAAGLNRDTCAGDSGGPVYVLGSDAILYLAAATSRAVDKTGKCGPGGIYVKLSSRPIKNWLVEMGVPKHAFAN